jgi:DNA-binding CsgD family transcriptional regulator
MPVMVVIWQLDIHLEILHHDMRGIFRKTDNLNGNIMTIKHHMGPIFHNQWPLNNMAN